MFNIIPLILILISLVVIIVIVVRKFAILANLDIDNIPAEKEAKFKEQIISNRLKRNFLKYYNKIAKVIKPIGQGLNASGKWLINKLVEFKENYNKETGPGIPSEQNIEKLFIEAEELVKREELDEAEKKYIEIISFDSKNNQAFRELGKLYQERKDFNEAKQSFEHALKLLEQQDENSPAVAVAEGGEGSVAPNSRDCLAAGIYHDLALVCRGMEDNAGVFANIKKALFLEPNNPRYLDIKLEISIINKDKIAALDAFEKLQAVNPENQKLAEWEKLISEL